MWLTKRSFGMNDYRVIALALVDATKNVLIKDCRHPAFLEGYRNNLAVIVGSGKATYCELPTLNLFSKAHKIRIGFG